MCFCGLLRTTSPKYWAALAKSRLAYAIAQRIKIVTPFPGELIVGENAQRLWDEGIPVQGTQIQRVDRKHGGRLERTLIVVQVPLKTSHVLEPKAHPSRIQRLGS